MVVERSVLIEDNSYIAVISDEPKALLAAKAAGRAVVGVEREGSLWRFKGVPYVVPSLDDATPELLELVMRRHLGFPWHIEQTPRLLIRELVTEDALNIPEEEYREEEKLFRSPEMLELYRKNQYGFYEYGTWALVRREDGRLIGLAGVSNPRLPNEMEACLEGLNGAVSRPEGLNREISRTEGPEAKPARPEDGPGLPWLELGYHIFRPFRSLGYGKEAVDAIAGYSHEVLGVRLCALIHSENQASRRVAESLGMKCVMGTDTESSKGRLLYAEIPGLRPDKAVP